MVDEKDIVPGALFVSKGRIDFFANSKALTISSNELIYIISMEIQPSPLQPKRRNNAKELINYRITCMIRNTLMTRGVFLEYFREWIDYPRDIDE